MSSLSEIDRDLDQIVVDAARLAEVRKGVLARGTLGAKDADAELQALASGVVVAPRAAVPAVARAVEAPRPDTEPPPPDADEGPPSGLIDVPDDVLASAELPAVLALEAEAAPPAEPLSLDLDSEETGLGPEPDELPAIATSASVRPPPEVMAPVLEPEYHAPPTETRALGDDPSADLASLLGDSDPMRDEGSVPLVGEEMEPEPTAMFTAEDAERYSRPAPPLDEELMEGSDVELDLDEMIEIEEDEPAEEPVAAAPPRTAPPPPPRTGPPPPPGSRPSEAPPARGFLGKLLQRKP